MKNYDLMLTTLFLRGAMTKESILSMNSCPRTMYKLIKKAESQKHIRLRNNGGPRIFTNKTGTAVSRVYIYELTQGGLRYLITNKSCALFEHISLDETKNIRATKKMVDLNKWELAVIRTNEAATLSALAGAYVAPVLSYPNYLVKEIERKADYYSYSELKALALSRMNHDETKQMQEELQLSNEVYYRFYFTDATSVKKIASETSSSATANQDFNKCQLSGILHSPIKSVLFYSAFGNHYKWNDWIVKYDRAALNLSIISEEKKEIREQLLSTRFCAALLVRNALQFKKLYFDDANVRSGKKNLGEEYEHMYVIPVSYDGAMNLRDDIMFRSDEKTNEMFIEGRLQHGAKLVGEMDEAKRLAFPVELADGVRLCYGCIMDVRKFLKMESEMGLFPDASYAVYCYDWQRPYYGMIFGDRISFYEGNDDEAENTPCSTDDDEIYEYYDDIYEVDDDFEEYNDLDLLDRMNLPFSPVFHDLDFMDDLNDEEDEWT